MSDETARCVFCDIVAGEAAAHRIYENDLALVILDINPFSRGHCLVLSKRHVPWWHDLASEEADALFAAARTVANRMMEALKPEFVCIYARGRRIPHTHVFLVPTFRGDPLDRYFNALEGFQEAPEKLAGLRQPAAMEETARLLRVEE